MLMGPPLQVGPPILMVRSIMVVRLVEAVRPAREPAPARGVWNKDYCPGQRGFEPARVRASLRSSRPGIEPAAADRAYGRRTLEHAEQG